MARYISLALAAAIFAVAALLATSAGPSALYIST